MRTETEKIFKKFKGVYFTFSDPKIMFCWCKNEKLPANTIYVGIHGAPRPILKLTPYDIKEISYNKKTLFKKGLLMILGTNNKVLFTAEFSDKQNQKNADEFNEWLKIYKETFPMPNTTSPQK